MTEENEVIYLSPLPPNACCQELMIMLGIMRC